MLSKNNFKERLHQMEPRRERFSIRKLAVGAASVLIGLTFLGITGTQEVHADKGSTANLETDQMGNTPIDKQQAKENQGQKQENVPEQNNEQKVDLKTQNGGVPEASNPRLIESSLIKKNGPVGIKPASEPTDKKENNNELKDTAGEVVHVYLPDNNNDSGESSAHNGQSDYTLELDKKITGQKDNSGAIKWNTVKFDSQDIIDLLNQSIFTNDKTGVRNQKVAIDLNEYTPVIEYAQASSPDESKNSVLYDRLTNYLKAYLKAHKDTTTLPEFEIDYPGHAIFGIHFVKKEEDTAGEEVHVYLPNNNSDSTGNSQSDYTYELDKKITGQRDNSGAIKWNTVKFDSQDIIDLLNQSIFTNDKTGIRNQKVTVDLNEYTPVIEYAQVSSPDESKNSVLYDRLTDYLKAYFKAHKDNNTTLPEFEIDYPGHAIFGIHFVKKSNPGDDNNPGGNDNNPGDNTPNNPGNNNNPGNTTPTTPTNPGNNNPGNNDNPSNDNKGNKTPENNTHKKSNPSKKNNRHNQKHYNENSGVKNSNVRARHLSNVNAKAEKAANGQVLSAKANKVSENSSQNNKTNANVKSLPATGEEQTHLGLIGLALAGFAALIGLATDRKRN